MSLADDTRWMDATSQARLVARGEASPGELVRAAIDRIEALDQGLGAVNMRWFDQAVAEADATTTDRNTAGPFRGVPFLLKDLEAHVAGRPMSNGNLALARAAVPSAFDTELVGRYRRAGFVFAGRTASPEFGSLPVTESVAWGATRNPWDRDRTPGGSSGGAGVAVATGMVPVAHGSDGGGSIRIPASCCGLFGLKPSQGRITMGPNRSETIVAVDHVLSRTVRDSAAVLDATVGASVGDVIRAVPPERSYVAEVGADPGRLRIGLLDRSLTDAPLPAPVVDAVRAAASLLEGLGHRVELAHPAPLDDPGAGARFGMLRSPVMAQTIDRIAHTLGRELDDDEVEVFNRLQADVGRAMTATDYVDAMDGAVEYRRQMHQWWADGWDLLLTPTLAELPLPIGTIRPDPNEPWGGLLRAGAFVPFTPPFNMTGQPAVSLPLHWTDDRLPVGVQLVGAYGREDLLIRVSSQLEAAHPWAARRPPD